MGHAGNQSMDRSMNQSMDRSMNQSYDGSYHMASPGYDTSGDNRHRSSQGVDSTSAAKQNLPPCGEWTIL